MTEREARKKFLSFRRRVDSDELLDGFDLALGWLCGSGIRHSTAMDWIEKWKDEGILTWDAMHVSPAGEVYSAPVTRKGARP